MSATANNQAVQDRDRHHHKQYWIKDKDQSSWWPWGWLLFFVWFVLLLAGLFLIAPDIQADTAQDALERLNGSSLGQFEIDSNGQEITIRGQSTVPKETVHAFAQSTKCKTWAGNLVCPTEVKVDVTQIQPAELAKLDTSTLAATDTITHDFQFTSSEAGIRLEGKVPDRAMQDAIMTLAQSRFENIDNQMKVTGDKASSDYPRAIERALGTLSVSQTGKATWQDERLSISMTATDENKDTAENLFNNPINKPPLGGFTLAKAHVVSQSLDECNTTFQSLLSNSTIEFEFASAEINARSMDLLRKLAVQANQCPGNLNIEGHSDDIGTNESNKRMSLLRAKAVRNALINMGVSPNRLNVFGLGATQPIADNQSEKGRAKNRRIIIKSIAL